MDLIPEFQTRLFLERLSHDEGRQMRQLGGERSRVRGRVGRHFDPRVGGRNWGLHVDRSFARDEAATVAEGARKGLVNGEGEGRAAAGVHVFGQLRTEVWEKLLK